MAQRVKDQFSDSQLRDVARLMGALSEVSRLRLVRELMRGEQTVSELTEATGMKQGNVSKHLGILLVAGVVSRRQHGNFARYALVDGTVAQLCSLVCRRIPSESGLP